MPFDAASTSVEALEVTKPGRPEVSKPDKEWAAAELARWENEAEHFRSIGSPLAEHAEAMAAELRAGVTGRQWRADKPWALWKQRRRGLLHAGTYDPKQARHLALMIAVGQVHSLVSARAVGDADAADEAEAELACRDAAETCGTEPRPLVEALASAEDIVARGEEPERLEWSRAARDRKVEFLAVEIATGVSIDTLLEIYGPR